MRVGALREALKGKLCLWSLMGLLLAGCRPSAPSEPPPLDSPPSSPSVQPRERPPSDEFPELSWTALSANGRVEVRQNARQAGACTLGATVAPSPGVAWTRSICVATREQLKFVSPDGERLLVLEPLPVIPVGGWGTAETVRLYERGRLLKATTAAAFVQDPRKLRRLSRHFGWLKGTAGLRGIPPRYAPDGRAIEFDTADGRTIRLGFDKKDIPPPPREVFDPDAPPTLYFYEDEDGTLHFVSSLREVPPRYRSRAAPMSAHIEVVRQPRKHDRHSQKTLP